MYVSFCAFMNSAFGPMLSLSTPVNQYAPYFKEQKLLIIGWSIVFKKLSIFHDDSEFPPEKISHYYYHVLLSHNELEVWQKKPLKKWKETKPKNPGPALCLLEHVFWRHSFEVWLHSTPEKNKTCFYFFQIPIFLWAMQYVFQICILLSKRVALV